MPIDKTNAIFKTETINGKLYRVMYFRGRGGQLVRSKFPQLIKSTPPSTPKKKLKSKPVTSTKIVQTQIQPRQEQPSYIKRSENANQLVSEWESLARRQ